MSFHSFSCSDHIFSLPRRFPSIFNPIFYMYLNYFRVHNTEKPAWLITNQFEQFYEELGRKNIPWGKNPLLVCCSVMRATGEDCPFKNSTDTGGMTSWVLHLHQDKGGLHIWTRILSVRSSSHYYIYDLALLSVSTKHSRTRIRAYTIPRFNLSALDFDPAYVGRISLLISSITDKSCWYLLCDWGSSAASCAAVVAFALPRLFAWT